MLTTLNLTPLVPMHRTRKGTYNVVASRFEIAVDLEGWPALALGLQKSMVFGVICKRQKGPLPSALCTAGIRPITER
jgi:hypothetical protein